VPDLWFPTNLLALTPATAASIVENRVTTVAASIDGFTKDTYEKIRVPAKWERLLACLDVLAAARREHGSKTPRLRIIFTWMKSNRGDLALLPAFAAAHGASEIDVRFVSPTEGVDVGPELLSDEDPEALNSELAAAAREAVRRGLRLASYPQFESRATRPRGLAARAARRLWRIRAGLDRVEYLRHSWYKRLSGCAYPGRNYVIRPNGAVHPCIYWKDDPIGFYPQDGIGAIEAGSPLVRIQEGLRTGRPVGTCDGCQERGFATMYRLRSAARTEAASARLPTHPG
jgi:MoaA/NifB/PqqE/SkfB family radical SAM enzyme